jgi:trk system potassium uptake protein
MKFVAVLGILGRLNFMIGLAMLPSIALAWWYQEPDLVPLAQASITTLVISMLISLIFRSPKKDITHREGIMIVSFGWMTAALFGALPFLLTGTFGPMGVESFVNSYFESISGLTTTGASVLGSHMAIEKLSHGLLLWRSLSHWLGGMGIIVLTIAILPLLGIGGMQLYKAEMPGPMMEKLKPRVRQTAMTLWFVYIALTAIEVVMLWIGGMPPFDAFCHTFGTIATGGFSTKTASIGFYQSAYIHWVILFFMICAGTNFSLHYLALTTKMQSYWKSREFRYFIYIILAATAGFSSWLYFGGHYSSITESIQKGSFQVVSILTTTGYATANYEKWPLGLQFVLFFFMFFGGCAGSTSGSIKIIRTVLLVKYAYREIFRLVHPRAFAAVKFGNQVINKDILESISGFFILYMGIFVVCSIIMTSLGLDIITAFTSVAATLGNIGPGLGSVGPSGNYFHIPLVGKGILIFCMILGRLEIYTVLVLLIPAFWKK